MEEDSPWQRMKDTCCGWETGNDVKEIYVKSVKSAPSCDGNVISRNLSPGDDIYSSKRSTWHNSRNFLYHTNISTDVNHQNVTFWCENSSMVECQFSKLNVAGSSPVSRSIWVDGSGRLISDMLGSENSYLYAGSSPVVNSNMTMWSRLDVLLQELVLVRILD